MRNRTPQRRQVLAYACGHLYRSLSLVYPGPCACPVGWHCRRCRDSWPAYRPAHGEGGVLGTQPKADVTTGARYSADPEAGAEARRAAVFELRACVCAASAGFSSSRAMVVPAPETHAGFPLEGDAQRRRRICVRGDGGSEARKAQNP